MHDFMSIFQMMDDGKNEEALSIVRQVLAELDENNDAYQGWLNALGYIYCNLLAYNKAIAVYNQYIELSQRHADMENLHIGFHQKAMALRLDQQYAAALDCIRKEKEIIAEHFAEDPLKASVNAYEYGYICFLMGHCEEAALYMAQCLEAALKTDDLIAQACAYRGLAEISSKTGKTQQAKDAFDKAYELFMKAGDPIGAEEVNQLRKNTPLS